MQYFLLIFFTVGTLFLSAQNETYRIDKGKPQPGEKAEYLVGDIVYVPFKNQLYKSHFDKELMEHNQLEYAELRDSLQQGLARAIAIACDSNYTIVSLGSHQSRLEQDLNIIHEALSYDYKRVPTGTNDESLNARNKVGSMLKKFRSNDKQKQKEGTYIENGQLVSQQSKGEKYMSVYLDDQDVLKVFAASYKNNHILSVNQFEFVVPATVDPIQLQTGIYDREIVVHYSFLDRKGKEVKGGKARVSVPSNVLSINDIANSYLMKMGQQIARSLPPPQHEPQIER